MLAPNRNSAVRAELESGQERLPVATPPQSLLVAVDTIDESEAPLRVTAALARLVHARPRVVTALSVPADAPGGAPASGRSNGHRAQRQLEVADLVSRVTNGVGGWPVEAEYGRPGAVIAGEIARSRPELVVLGLRPHDLAYRIFHDEIVLEVLRGTTTPALCVTPTLTELPRRIVAAVDFSRGSLRALSLALRIAAPDASVHLVHVQPPSAADDGDARRFSRVYAEGVEAAFRHLARLIRTQLHGTVRMSLRRGAPAEELLRAAEESNADLITVGTHRYALTSRQMLGSVTASLVRAGRCSLLLAPPGTR